uniref:DUF1618 domain-containing protein n=1 Tax=Aegilops tauschii TaxID=37682 RepID=R7WDX2_AEGTA
MAAASSAGSDLSTTYLTTSLSTTASRRATAPRARLALTLSSSPPPADTIAYQNLALDFLPLGEFGDCRWELADIRGGLLLLFHRSRAPRLLICDPLARRYKEIPRSAWFHGCNMLGAFLLDGKDADADADAGISLSNFRVTCMVFRLRDRNARACAFSSAVGRWVSTTAHSSKSVVPDGDLDPIHFAGSDDWSAYWTVRDNTVIVLDKDVAELLSFVVPDDEEYHALWEKRHDIRCHGHLLSKIAYPSCIGLVGCG